ncbi:DUF502 domain-containing protein [Adhaeribacter soli]|uniref:DUF502 domain-containing protein n=1 Tax=Adhaeribacter soli TaxID=2607655 RepID=A0A5N1J2X0_9BACT|nr:DUF502 domain-containing protein [Adhaeribacter soli]KAA9340856.1 DUF502 domain-containing protein [Adhaeribacter soli]
MKRLFKYFLNGFLIIAPITLTIYIIVAVIAWLDEIFDIGELPMIGRIPGLGIFIIIILLTVVGYLGSSFLVRPFLVLAERILTKVPLVSIIYSSLKDLFDAFVGDNQKFNCPVMVKMHDTPETFRMGFITQDNLESLHMEDLVAVYFPDSYNISGELWFVKKDNVRFIQLPSSEVMKFVVSGGVAKL